MEDLSPEEIVRRLKDKLSELKRNEENIPHQFSVVLKAFQFITLKFIVEPEIYTQCLLKYIRYLLSLKNKLHIGNADDVYENKFSLLTKTLGTIIGVPKIHGSHQTICDLLFYWLTSTKYVPAELKLEVLDTQKDAFKNLVILAASSGDNETQRQIFELMLLCYADGMFELATRQTIADYFKAVNFEAIEHILHSFDTLTNGKLKKHEIRTILHKFNGIVEKKVLSLIVNDIKIGQNVLLPAAKSGFWIDFNPGSNSISFAFDGKSITGSSECSRTVRALISQDMIRQVHSTLCGEARNINLTFTLCKPLSLSDSQTQKLIASEREMKIELAYSEEKFPVLEELLNDWYKVEIFVAESDNSCNGDEEEFPFTLPFNVAREQRTFCIPKLSCVADSTHTSEISNEHKQQTYSMTNDHVSGRSEPSDCEMIVEESENGGEQDESDIVEIDDGVSIQSADSIEVHVNEELRSNSGCKSPESAPRRGSIDEPHTNGSENADEPQQNGVHNDDVGLSSSTHNKVGRSPIVNERNREKVASLEFRNNGNRLQKVTVKEVNNQKRTIPVGTSSVNGVQPKRKKFNVNPKQIVVQNDPIEVSDDDLEEPCQSPKRVKTAQSKHSATAKSTNGASQWNKQLYHRGRKSIEFNLRECNGHEVDDHFHQTYVERTPALEHVVHPTQLISRAKPIPSQRANGERASCWTPAAMEIVHPTQDIPRQTNRSRFASSPDCTVHSTQTFSDQIVHPTQIVSFAESSQSAKDTNGVIRIEAVSPDEVTDVARTQMSRKAKQAANSSASERSSTILVVADVHSSPSEIDAIVKKREEDAAKRSSKSTSSRKPAPQPNDIDAIELYDTYDERRKKEMKNSSLIVAQPKRTRKSPTQSTSKTVPKVAPKFAKASSKQTPQQNATADGGDDSIYYVSTQPRRQTNDSERHEPVKATVDEIINRLHEDHDPPEMSASVEPPMEPLPVEPFKPRRKAIASRPRAKAAPKTQRKTKNTSSKQPKLTFEMPKSRQTRKKVIENNGGVSPCSEIASVPTIGRGASVKRKLYNKGDEIIDLDGDDLPPVQSKRINTNYEDILDTTVSTTGCGKKSVKFLDRVAENMDKISSHAKKPSPPEDPFDALRMETDNENGIRSDGKVSYSYRTSSKAKPDVNTPRICSTKKSTSKKNVDVIETINCKTAEDRNVICSTRSDASDIGDYEAAIPDNRDTEHRQSIIQIQIQIQIQKEEHQRLVKRVDEHSQTTEIETASIRSGLEESSKQIMVLEENLKQIMVKYHNY